MPASHAATEGTMPTSDAPDLDAIKAKQWQAWSTGDYAQVGTTLQIVGERLVEALDLRPGQRVLDVAAGNGNASLAAARCWCEVVSTDYVPAWLEKGRERAHAERLAIEFRPADAENLPFDDGSFDVVTSTFGVMFTPNQQRAADEMLRVCRSGGRLGMANWTPEGFVGQMFKVIGKYTKPPAGLRPPSLWGTRDHLHKLFGAAATAIYLREQSFVFRYKSAEHWLYLWKEIYGPLKVAFETQDAANHEKFADDLLSLVDAHNFATDGTMVVPAKYAEIVITLR